jgi:hypothetical protein
LFERLASHKKNFEGYLYNPDFDSSQVKNVMFAEEIRIAIVVTKIVVDDAPSTRHNSSPRPFFSMFE